MRLPINDRILLPIVALVGFSLTLVGGSVWYSARQQDEVAIQQSLEAADFAMRDRLRQIGRAAKEFAWSSEAVRNLDLRFTPSWAQSNIRRFLFEQQGYDMAFVIDRSGRTLYAQLDGEPVGHKVEQHLAQGLDLLIEQAQWAPWQEPQPTMGFLKLDGGVGLVAVCAVSLDPKSQVALPRGRRMIMVVAQRLTDDLLRSIGDGLSLQNLSLLIEPPPQSEIALPLRAPDGTKLGALVWQLHKPGQRFLLSVAPVLSMAGLVFIGFSLLVIHKVRHNTRTIAANEARFRDVANASSDWIWETDSKGRLTYLSDQFTQSTGRPSEAMLGQPLRRFLRYADDSLGRPGGPVEFLKEGKQFRDALCEYRSADGPIRTLRVAGAPMLDNRGRLLGVRGTATDITAEIAAERRIRQLALHDALTGLPNREQWRTKVVEALERMRRQGGAIGVLCLDLDRFKHVNDTLGHSAGDLLIKGCAQRLQAQVRATDTVARLGGDEFVILQTGAAQPEGAIQLARRVVDALSRPHALDGNEVLATASVGVATTDNADMPAGRLLQEADIALYRAKDEGRNVYRVYEPGMDSFLRDRKQLERDLRQALESDEFELFYQPKMELLTGSVVGAEALMRWRHPKRKLIMPGEFIGLAETTGLILALGEWVVRSACQRAALWPEIRVALNISPVQFQYRDLVGLMERTLIDTGIGPEQIELEITEGVLLRNTEAAMDTLRQLKAMGLCIVMDDFGKRYSGMDYLLRFQFDKLKIDRGFVAGLGRKPNADAIVRAILGLSRDLAVRVCAEGVETEEQLEFLRHEGCDEVQGLLIGEAVPAIDFERHFRFDRRTSARRQRYAAVVS